MANKEDTFEARRASRQKKLRKKRRKRIFFFVLFLIVAVGVTLSLTVLFPIKVVRAKGSKVYNEITVVKAADIKGCNIFTLSEKKLLQKVRTKLPFVGELTFERYLPDGVMLTVKDAKEYCYYKAKDGYYSASSDGYCLKKYEEPPENLFEVVCSSVKLQEGKKVKIKSDSESALVKKLIDGSNKNGINLAGIDVSNIASIKVSVEGRFTVDFGTGTYLDEKLLHLKSMIKNIDASRKGDINLSMWSPQKSEGTFIEKQ